jgi:hypothetical protein
MTGTPGEPTTRPQGFHRYVSTVMFTVDRRRLDHIALAADDMSTAIAAGMSVGVELDEWC